MVMEAPPSPQSVGREFVRQYYTLLNKAPTHLHRFYNHQSSFIHGGLDPPNRETSPVIGQKQIHQKIQQLNFRDCHAKITQVDSQATLGNGVVVQVTGELSNAGQPMRRFTQTFVLAAQSPKKYYVHNDIFRYQDEIVSEEDEEEGEEEEEEDEGCEGDGRSDQEEDVQGGQVMMDAQLPINQPPVPPYYPNAGQMPAGIPPVPIHHSQQQPQHVINAQAVPTVNGAIHPDDINNINVMQGQVPTHVPAAQVVQAPGAPMPGMPQGSVPTPIPPAPIEEQHQQQLGMEERMEDHVEADWADYGAEEAKLEVEEDSNVLESSSNEPKTYANLLKSGGAVPFAGPPAPQQQQHQPPLAAPSFVSTAQPPRSASPPPASGGYQPMGGRPGGPSGRPGGPRGAGQGQSRMPGRQDSVGRGGSMGGGRSSMNEDVPYEDRRRSQSQTFNDVNQLFLGNLPHCAGEDDLRAIFADFGAILDLRVHSKPSNNGKVGGAPVGRAPPNYGFITFETQQGVQNCLQAKPIYYPKDDKNGTLLNVEEKKTKDRPSYGGGRPNTDGRGGGRGDNGGPRRGGMGGMGGSTRGGLGPNRPNAYSSRGGGPPNRGSNAYNRR